MKEEKKPKARRSDKNISVDLTKDGKEAIRSLAKASGMRLSEYVRSLAEYAIVEKLTFKWEKKVVRIPKVEIPINP